MKNVKVLFAAAMLVVFSVSCSPNHEEVEPQIKKGDIQKIDVTSEKDDDGDGPLPDPD